jgi:hypothetical protein
MVTTAAIQLGPQNVEKLRRSGLAGARWLANRSGMA